MLLLLNRALSLNKQVRTRCASIRFLSASSNEDKDHRNPIKVNEDYVVQIKEPIVVKPVKQELIKRIPVEYHGVIPAQFNDQSEWLPIFRTPYLNAMRLLVKFKLCLTAFSLSSSLLYCSQVILGSEANPWKAAILSTITLLGFTFIGDYARRLVVQIYVSPDEKYVRFCRFTFFGKRRDMVLPRDCIVRLTEVNPVRRAPILNLQFTMPEKGVDIQHDHLEFYELGFRIPIVFGGVLDTKKFNAALGKILVEKPLNN
jgi:hypothetical protein